MRIKTNVKPGGTSVNHNDALCVRTALKAGGWYNHNEALRVRTALKAGGWFNHNEALRVRSMIRGGATLNHNDALRVRTALKVGGVRLTNHTEALRREADPPAIAMRRLARRSFSEGGQPTTTVRKQDRLQLLVVRAGLRAGARRLGLRR